MSDGIKAMYEDMEQEAYERRIKRISEIKPEKLMQIFDKLKAERKMIQDSYSLCLPLEYHRMFVRLRESMDELP